MTALLTLEWGMNIPVLTEIQSKLSNLKDKIKLTDTSVVHEYQYNAGTISSDVIEYIESWINSTNCVPEPTWRNFFKILKDTSPELDQLTYQIKEIFHGRLQN